MLEWVFAFGILLLALFVLVIAAILYGDDDLTTIFVAVLIIVALVGGLCCVLSTSVGNTNFNEMDIKSLDGRYEEDGVYYIYKIIRVEPAYNVAAYEILILQEFDIANKKLGGPVFLWKTTNLPDEVKAGMYITYEDGKVEIWEA